MSRDLARYVADRERVTARPSVVSYEIDSAAAKLNEVCGPIGARRWCERLAIELRTSVTPTVDVALLAEVPQLAEQLTHAPGGSIRERELMAEIDLRVRNIVAAFVDGET